MEREVDTNKYESIMIFKSTFVLKLTVPTAWKSGVHF